MYSITRVITNCNFQNIKSLVSAMPEVRILQLDCVEAAVAYLTTLQSDALLDLCSEEKLNISVAERRASVKGGQKVSNSQLVAIILKKQLTAWSYVIDLPISTRVNLLSLVVFLACLLICTAHTANTRASQNNAPKQCLSRSIVKLHLLEVGVDFILLRSPPRLF